MVETSPEDNFKISIFFHIFLCERNILYMIFNDEQISIRNLTWAFEKLLSKLYKKKSWHNEINLRSELAI